MKLGAGRVPDKPGFKKASGGLVPKEMTPGTRGLFSLGSKLLSVAEGVNILGMAYQYYHTGGVSFGTLPDGTEVGIGTRTVQRQVGTLPENASWIPIWQAQLMIDTKVLKEGDYFVDISPVLLGTGQAVLCRVVDGKPYVTGYTYRPSENAFVKHYDYDPDEVV